MEADLVIRRARLLTLAPLKDERPRVGASAGDVGAIDDGWVASRDGVIAATGRGDMWERLELTESANVVDAAGAVVMPGFVDAHTHLCYAGHRWDEFVTRKSGADYLAVLERGGGIHATVRATREASGDALAALLEARLATAAALGTTTIEVKSGYGLEPAEELRQLRVIARVRKTASIDIAPTYLALHAIPNNRTEDRRAFVQRAAENVAIVASEGLAEAVDAFFVGYAPPDARRFLAADVPVAVATDHNPGTSPLVGLPAAIALAVTLCGLSPHQAIVAATINAAHALGRGERTGAPVKGRRADIVILRTDDERELAYSLGAPLVHAVFAAGRSIGEALAPDPAVS